MSTLLELRQKYPEFFKDKSDTDLVRELTAATGQPQTVVAFDLGLNHRDYAENAGVLSDSVNALGVGIQGIPGTLAGLGDMAVAGINSIPQTVTNMVGGNPNLFTGTPFTAGVNWVEDKIGTDAVQDRWQATQSLERQAFLEEQRKSQEAGNYWDYAANLATSPSQWLPSLAEMAPGMAVGGLGGRGLKGAKWAENTLLGKYGYAVGEAGVSGGQSMNQMLADGANPQEAAGLALGSGAVVGTVGALGARLGNRLGVRDIEQSLAGYGANAGERQLGYGTNLLAAGSLEGGQEAIPSPFEQIALNVATDKPWI